MSEITLKINNRQFDFWSSFSLTRSIGSSDTFSFEAPMVPENKAFRDTFKPLTFQSIEAFIDGVKSLTGVAVGINPVSDPSGSRVVINGYAKTGILSDCQISSDEYPIEYIDLNFEQIARKVIEPFGVGVVIKDGVGQPFELVGANISQKAMSFLASLAKERGLVLGTNGSGQLVVQKANVDDKPIAVLTDGEAGVSNVAMTSDAQKIYSSVTAMGSTLPGLPADKYTAKNNRVTAFRPFVFNTEGASGGDTKTDAEARIGRMYGDALSWSVDVAAWSGPDGKIWQPNTIISLLAPDAMIYSQSRFLIKTVSLRQSANEETATLSLVLPESYSSKVPERLPWE